MLRRLNIFQRCMLDWNSMHPYNAVHVVRVANALDTERMRRVINGALEARGLTRLALNETRGTYSYGGGPADCAVKWLKIGDDFNASLAAEIENQLNTPFKTDGMITPLRFFGGDFKGSSVLGLAYLHAMADAEGVVRLMKEITEAYVFGKAPVFLDAASPAPQRYLAFSHPRAFARKLCAFPSAMADMRSSCRPRYHNPQDLRNGFRLFSLESAGLRRLVRTAKVWGVTVNDILIAMLLKGLAGLAVGRGQVQRRRKLSVGCIVNTRRDFPAGSLDAFGLYLGSFVLTHAVPGQITIEELAKDVGRRTQEIKRKKLYLANSLELSFGRFLLSFFSVERRKKLYQKHYPLWGGVTNMNVNPIWDMVQAKQCDYFRGVSTGPASPMVLSFTTAGEVANIGLSYRSTVFSQADIDRLMGSFRETALASDTKDHQAPETR